MWKKITGVTLNYSDGDNNGNPLAFFPHRSGMVALSLENCDLPSGSDVRKGDNWSNSFNLPGLRPGKLKEILQ